MTFVTECLSLIHIFSISDIVLNGQLPEKIKDAAEMYAGCVAGAINKEKYLGYIKKAGFQNVVLQKEKNIFIPDDILSLYPVSYTHLDVYKRQG